MTSEVNVSPEFAEVLSQDEQTAQMIERAALAIFIGGQWRLPITPEEETAWANLWASSDVATRVRCRNQARAALAASSLLKRVEELEQRVAAAQRELTIYAGELNAQALTAKVRRVGRILEKPLPVEQPPTMKESRE